MSPSGEVFLPGRDAALESVSCPQPDVCVVVGWDGGIIRTEEGGQSWQPQHTTGTPRFEDVHFTDADTGWVAGRGPSVLLHTSDGGDTWQEVPLTPAAGGSPAYKSVSFADEDTGTVVGANGYIWRTEDGGQTWVEAQRRTNIWLSSVAHVDADTAVVVGEEGVILKRVGDDSDPGDPDPVPSEGSQDIVATVPDQPGDGSLVLSVDPDDRTVTLPELVNAGDRLSTSGGLRPVTGHRHQGGGGSGVGHYGAGRRVHHGGRVRLVWRRVPGLDPERGFPIERPVGHCGCGGGSGVPHR